MHNKPKTLKTGQVRQYYDKKVSQLEGGYFAHRWDSNQLRREQYQQTRASLLRELHQKKFGYTVEVGTGSCVWTRLLADHSEKVVGMDISLTMLRDCAQDVDDPGLLCCADVARLPLSSATFEALFSMRAFEYFPDKDRAIGEFYRILKPGGYLLIVTKNREYGGYGINVESPCAGDRKKAALHSGNVTSDELIELLERHDFSKIKVRPTIIGRTNVIAIWRVIRFLRRYFEPLWPRGIPRIASSAVESFMVTAYK